MYYLRFFSSGAELETFYTVCFIKILAFFNMNVAVYDHTVKCVGGHTKLFMKLSPALGTGPVSNGSYNHPTINHLLKSLELFWQLRACWTPEHISPLSTLLQWILSGLQQLLQGIFFPTGKFKYRNWSSESWVALITLFSQKMHTQACVSLA